jgi:hypothetical protein
LDLWKWGRNRPWGPNPWQHYDDFSSPYVHYMPCPSHPPWFDHLSSIW